MKKLQNDFTTPEQSKRLLELGVPADSADVPMIVFKDGTYIYKEVLKDRTLNDYQAEDDAFQDEQDYPYYVHYWPCWSVGRLMEIIDICCKLHLYEDWVKTRLTDETVGIPVEHLVSTMEYLSSDKSIDFSKLED